MISKVWKRKRLDFLWHMHIRFMILMRRCRWRICLGVRCFRRWHSATVVRTFLRVFASDAAKLKLLAKEFTRRIKLVQAYFKSYLAVQVSRVDPSALLTPPLH